MHIDIALANAERNALHLHNNAHNKTSYQKKRIWIWEILT